MCDAVFSGRFPPFSFVPSRGCAHLPEGMTKLSLSEDSFVASSGLGREERERGLAEPRGGCFGEELRERGFLGGQRAGCLGEQEPGVCFDDIRVVKCFDELGRKIRLFEDLKGSGQAFPRDCADGLFTASPVVCMTLMCC